MSTTYQLLAIDVDGTLIGADQAVAPGVVDALATAGQAGLRVCLATGRSYVETLPVWRQLRLAEPYEPIILICGALVSQAATGRTLYSRSIDRELACSYADALNRLGYPAMAIVDAWRWGVDYYLAESADAADATRDWFSKMDVTVRRVRRLADADQMPEPLRINTVVPPDQAETVASALSEQFDGRLNIHAIRAPNYAVTVVEAFDAGVDKATALTYVAQAHRIPAARIAAVGDDVNDVSMLQKAGLGVAMADATDPAKEAADITASDGLAAFVTDLLAGRFG